MESLDIKLDSDIVNQIGNTTILHDVCLMAMAAEKNGFRITRTNFYGGIPRTIVIIDIQGKRTKEEIRDYAKLHLPWYKF